MPVNPSARLGLAPRPNGLKGLAPIVLMGLEDGIAVVAEYRPLLRSPGIFDEIARGYSFWVRAFDKLGTIALWGGLLASVVWHWWAFIPGGILALIVEAGNRTSVAQCLAGIAAAHPTQTTLVLMRHGLIWQVPASSIVWR